MWDWLQTCLEAGQQEEHTTVAWPCPLSPLAEVKAGGEAGALLTAHQGVWQRRCRRLASGFLWFAGVLICSLTIHLSPVYAISIFFTLWSVSRVQIPSSLTSPRQWEWSVKQTLSARVEQTLQQTGTWCRQQFVQKLEYLGWDLTKQLPSCPGRQPAIQRSERCAWCHILPNTAPNRSARRPFLSGRKFLVCQKNKTERASSTSWANSACRGFAKKTRRDTSARGSAPLLSKLFAGNFATRLAGCWVLCKTTPLICQALTVWRAGEPNVSYAAVVASYPADIETTCLGSCASHWRPRVFSVAWKSQRCTGSFPSLLVQLISLSHGHTTGFVSERCPFIFKQFLGLKQTSWNYQQTNGNVFSGCPFDFTGSVCKYTILIDDLHLHFFLSQIGIIYKSKILFCPWIFVHLWARASRQNFHAKE